MSNEEFDFNFSDAMSGPVQTASQQADDKLNVVLNKVSKWRSVMVLVVIAAITLVLPFVTFGLVNPLSMDFWVNAIYNLIIASLCYYIFIPFGARSERLESATYSHSVFRWTELSERVRTEGLIEGFYRFCSTRRQEEREERRMLFIEAAGVPLSLYKSSYAGLSPRKLKRKKRGGELTKRQIKYLIAANGEIKVRVINPSMVLSGLRISNINDVGRATRKKIFGFIRPLTLVLTMIIRGAIKIGGNADVDLLDYLAQTAVSLFIIVVWSFTGFRYGVSTVRDEEQLVRGRSEFLSMFLERAKRQKDEFESEKSPTEVGL